MKKWIGVNIIIIFMVILLGKIISLLRNIVISYYFGTSTTSDAYFAANNIPSIIYLAFISSYLVLLIPEHDKIKINNGLVAANKFVSRYLTFVVAVSLSLSILCYFFIEILIEVVAPNFNRETKELASSLGRILVLSFPFTAICLSLAAISSTHNKFYAQHIIPIFSGVFTILGLYLFVGQYGIYSLAVAGVLATVIQVVIQILISRSHFKYSFQKRLLDSNIKSMSILVLPIFVGYSIDQINLLANSIISSGLGTGSLSALTYAQNIQLTILGTVTTAMITVLYPRMSKLSSENKTEDLVKTTWTGIKYLIIILLPVTFYLAINVESLVKIVYFRGKFDELALTQTSNILLFYLINILLISTREFIVRYYYLFKRTTFPMIAGVISVFINIILSYMLVADFGVSGLSFANLIATLLSLLLLIGVLFAKREVLQISQDARQFFFHIFISMMLISAFHFSIKNHIHSENAIAFGSWFIVYLIIFYAILLLIRQREAVQTFSIIKSKFIYAKK
ncbi:murein biosynthesis integral membrane protein MurJ [Thiothrix winogradskyi]|uniref:Murein biosynthesis integral membrane protein MurJ n=1 Tax=Thiothrix winogradskyi TaxID=96472 RepID=A0ABY3SXN9_9GAMM|nr:murein biosynthesis integral membrane protein MurJ [Thiothrix winogradskyi]UJS24291.1 murein biosynthesis integral membrane protein MurJ [Thiothrix winogradskyi]